jgi:hypothetical protein
MLGPHLLPLFKEFKILPMLKLLLSRVGIILQPLDGGIDKQKLFGYTLDSLQAFQ